MGVAAVFVSVLVFAYYKHFAYKEFGGITGDLEGYFFAVMRACDGYCYCRNRKSILRRMKQ